MNREAFEQLLSAWLDRRDDAELAARVAAAVAAAPERRAVVEAWERMDALLRSAGPRAQVDWARFAAHVAAGLRADDAEDAAFDRRLADTTSVESRVEWPAFSRRVAAAIRTSPAVANDLRATAARPSAGADDASDRALDRLLARATDVDSRVAWLAYSERVANAARGSDVAAPAADDRTTPPRVIRFTGPRARWSLVGLAAAAVVALFAFRTPPRPTPSTGVGAAVALVDVQVASPTPAALVAHSGGASVDVAVAEEAPPAVARAQSDAEPEMLVVIEPTAESGPLVAYNDPYGLF